MSFAAGHRPPAKLKFGVLGMSMMFRVVRYALDNVTG